MKIIHFYHSDSDQIFPPFFLRYVRWKYEVNFVRRCFRDVALIAKIIYEVKRFFCFAGIDREQYFAALRGSDELKFVCESLY